MEPYNLGYIYQRMSAITKTIALYLPRTSDIRQIAEYAQNDRKTQIIHYCTNGNSRALSVFFGEWGSIQHEL